MHILNITESTCTKRYKDHISKRIFDLDWSTFMFKRDFEYKSILDISSYLSTYLICNIIHKRICQLHIIYLADTFAKAWRESEVQSMRKIVWASFLFIKMAYSPFKIQASCNNVLSSSLLGSRRRASAALKTVYWTYLEWVYVSFGYIQQTWYP